MRGGIACLRVSLFIRLQCCHSTIVSGLAEVQERRMKLNPRLFWLATMFFLFTCAPLLCDQQAGSSSKPNETSNATLPKPTANSAEREPKETEQEDAIATSGKNNASGFAIQRRTRLVLIPALVT